MRVYTIIFRQSDDYVEKEESAEDSLRALQKGAYTVEDLIGLAKRSETEDCGMTVTYSVHDEEG